jgi:hypothetical protein
MRVLCMHKADKSSEAGLPPDEKLMAGMGPLMEDMSKAGVMISGEGLRPSVHGVRLNFSGGRRTITKGPLTGGNELLAGFCMVAVRTIDEAIEWSSRYAAIVGDVELDVRPVCEAWDLGFCPKPEGLETTRFMLLQKADRSTEANAPPTPAQGAAMLALIDEMRRAGVFLAAEGLLPSRHGLRLKYAGGRRTQTDGPFTESKELIAGYVLLEVASLDEAVHWSTRFAALVGDIEIDIRPLQEACAPAPA